MNWATELYLDSVWSLFQVPIKNIFHLLLLLKKTSFFPYLKLCVASFFSRVVFRKNPRGNDFFFKIACLKAFFFKFLLLPLPSLAFFLLSIFRSSSFLLFCVFLCICWQNEMGSLKNHDLVETGLWKKNDFSIRAMGHLCTFLLVISRQFELESCAYSQIADKLIRTIWWWYMIFVILWKSGVTRAVFSQTYEQFFWKLQHEILFRASELMLNVTRPDTRP